MKPTGLTKLCSNATTVGPQEWYRLRQGEFKRLFQVSVSGTASVDIEATLDIGDQYVLPVKIQTAVTTNAGFVDEDPWTYVRANIVSRTSGQVSVTLREREVP